MLCRKVRLTLSVLVLLLLIPGCKNNEKAPGNDNLTTTAAIETTTNRNDVKDNEGSSRTPESLGASETENSPNVIYDFEVRDLKRVIIDGKVVVEYEYNDIGLRSAKKGNDDCKFTYDENKNLVKEERNGKVITYFYEEDKDYAYWYIMGFNYEGKNYYYTKDDKHRIDGIQNESKELIARYEYGIENFFHAERVMKRQGEKWVSTDDPEFIGNVNKIRNLKSYYDEECDLYYSYNGIFSHAVTGHNIDYN